MGTVGKHSGDWAPETEAAEPAYAAPKPTQRAILFLALILSVTLVAWGVLVYAAIDFGKEARSGEPTAWGLLVVSTIGAAACLFVTLIVGARTLRLVAGRRNSPKDLPPPPPAGGRRRRVD